LICERKRVIAMRYAFHDVVKYEKKRAIEEI